MRKVIPEHVALSAEELCELLKSDLLAKAFNDENESAGEGIMEKEPIYFIF